MDILAFLQSFLHAVFVRLLWLPLTALFVYYCCMSWNRYERLTPLGNRSILGWIRYAFLSTGYLTTLRKVRVDVPEGSLLYL